MEKEIRTFETGATRNCDDDRLDYEGFLAPIVLQRYALYMHQHRRQADGNMRESDNWQKGIPTGVYMKSLWRHFFEVWSDHRRGVPLTGYAAEVFEDALCAIMFNTMGYLFERLKARGVQTNVTTGPNQSHSASAFVNPAIAAAGKEVKREGAHLGEPTGNW